MKIKLVDICFLYPMIVSALNIQGWASILLSAKIGQIISYSNLILIFLGISLLIKNKKKYTRTGSLWLPFFFVYFVMSSIASTVYFFDYPIFASLVPVFFCMGYLVYFRFEENLRKFEILAIIVFSIANLILIIFVMNNFDYDFYQSGVQIDYGLDRAQGIYGDANNASLVGILGFIFSYECFKPQKKYLKALRLFLLLMSVYAMYLTYSTTGFVAFTLAFGLLKFKYFNKARLLLLPVIGIGFYIILLNLGTLLEGFDLNPRQKSKIDNFVNLVKLDFDNVDDSGRDEFVAELLEYIAESPFLGNGLGFGAYHHGHNTYLYILSDAGIFALIVFVILLFKYFENIFKIEINSRLYALAILISFCMFMLSLQTIINQPYLMVVFVYLAYYIDNKLKNKSQYDTE